MRILHVIDYFQPELGYQEAHLAREQALAGNEVHVVTSDRYFPFPDYKSTIYPLLGKRICGTGVSEFMGYFIHRLPIQFEISCRCWMANLENRICKIDPEIVHVHNLCNFTATRVARFKKRQRSPFRLIYDDHMVEMVSQRPYRNFIYSIFRTIFAEQLVEQADAFVAVTNETKEFMSGFYGIPSNMITVIPLGANTNRFRLDLKARTSIRKKLGISDDETVYIYAGKLTASKRPDWLVKAALKLIAKGDAIQVIMVGSGTERYVNEMKDLISGMGFAQRFHWVDALPHIELPAYFSASDVGVWPRECSVAMLEANACERPVIVSKIGPALERIQWNNGLSYPEGNIDELVKTMRVLHCNPQLRKEMGKSARDAVINHLSWPYLVRRFLDLVSQPKQAGKFP